jgi:hypothetical protein
VLFILARSLFTAGAARIIGSADTREQAVVTECAGKSVLGDGA